MSCLFSLIRICIALKEEVQSLGILLDPELWLAKQVVLGEGNHFITIRCQLPYLGGSCHCVAMSVAIVIHSLAISRAEKYGVALEDCSEIAIGKECGNQDAD